MGSKEILENVQSQDLEFYCSSVWNETYENAENRSFVNSFRQNFGETPKHFFSGLRGGYGYKRTP